MLCMESFDTVNLRMAAATDKNDVFVGNLAFDTKEEDIRELFTTFGRINEIRLVTDKDTGRVKGFAFVEFADASAALSAIRNLDGYDMKGRALRVSYSNNSSLRDVAQATGQDRAILSAAVQNRTSLLPLHEAYDILENMKKMVDEDRGHRAREILSNHPQLMPALAEIMVRLGLPAPEDHTV